MESGGLKRLILTALILSGLIMQTAYAESQGPNYPTIATFDVGWADEDSGRYCDNYFANWLTGDAGALALTGYGFDIPNDAHIDSFTTDAQLYAVILEGGCNSNIELAIGAGSKGTYVVMAGQWPEGSEGTVHGVNDSANGSWNPIFIPANVDSTEFGVSIVNLGCNNAEESYVDCVPLTVWYTIYEAEATPDVIQGPSGRSKVQGP